MQGGANTDKITPSKTCTVRAASCASWVSSTVAQPATHRRCRRVRQTLGGEGALDQWDIVRTQDETVRTFYLKQAGRRSPRRWRSADPLAQPGPGPRGGLHPLHETPFQQRRWPGPCSRATLPWMAASSRPFGVDDSHPGVRGTVRDQIIGQGSRQHPGRQRSRRAMVIVRYEGPRVAGMQEMLHPPAISVRGLGKDLRPL